MNKAEAYTNIWRLYLKTKQYASPDPEVALILSRKTTEAICKYVYSTKVSSQPNTMMLEALLTDLAKSRVVPRSILLPMRTVQSYGNYGGHDQEDEYGELDSSYAMPCINALETIMEWFERDNHKLHWALKTNVHNTGFSPGVLAILDNACLTSLAEVAARTRQEMEIVKGVTPSVISEIEQVLAEHDLAPGLRLDTAIIAAIEKASNKLFHRIARKSGSR